MNHYENWKHKCPPNSLIDFDHWLFFLNRFFLEHNQQQGSHLIYRSVKIILETKKALTLQTHTSNWIKIGEQITVVIRFQAIFRRAVSVIFYFLRRHFWDTFFIEITTTIWIFSTPKICSFLSTNLIQIEVWVWSVSTFWVSKLNSMNKKVLKKRFNHLEKASEQFVIGKTPGPTVKMVVWKQICWPSDFLSTNWSHYCNYGGSIYFNFYTNELLLMNTLIQLIIWYSGVFLCFFEQFFFLNELFFWRTVRFFVFVFWATLLFFGAKVFVSVFFFFGRFFFRWPVCAIFFLRFCFFFWRYKYFSFKLFGQLHNERVCVKTTAQILRFLRFHTFRKIYTLFT